MKKIEHIGIAVKNMEEAAVVFDALLDTKSYKTELVESEGVKTMFYKIGDQKIELLEATDQNSPIARFLEKRGEGAHHIAFSVDDIEAEMKKLVNKGFILLTDKPKIGADNKLICFLHPKKTAHVLIELCQEIKK